MSYFDVYVIDRFNKEKVCVLAFGSRTEANKVVRFLQEVDSCDIEVIESPFIYKKGKHEI